MCLYKNYKFSIKKSKMITIEDLFHELRKFKNDYESEEYYCSLKGYYDDGIRNIDFGANISENTKTIELLVAYIPRIINFQMERPIYLRFVFTSIAKRDMYTPRSYSKQVTLIDKIVRI